MTNDVVVSNLQVTKLTPAVIEAPNLDELVENTDKMLAKYQIGRAHVCTPVT